LVIGDVPDDRGADQVTTMECFSEPFTADTFVGEFGGTGMVVGDADPEGP
jgi:hypothetical protein